MVKHNLSSPVGNTLRYGDGMVVISRDDLLTKLSVICVSIVESFPNILPPAAQIPALKL